MHGQQIIRIFFTNLSFVCDKPKAESKFLTAGILRIGKLRQGGEKYRKERMRYGEMMHTEFNSGNLKRREPLGGARIRWKDNGK